ncbi:MBL fold metallo-hydrolase [Clostridium fallax]|uniref:L-ascorbate metabolism protein UlaG, beta-lactamase superfamily n=1 Tax=Clostridium fallax TaxID=1533 RepID=A0A1M4X024_9CLOT|nr:MBL fold metallo-hydrolase [Clostridium fallax]SHE86824.1 L-ascorbate metabolism protein UlaG, beta-lactamase superfamily [Clostridium fallax]SQB22568.1 putative Zn-dependent hydrolase of the beta-lactamase Fold protein [Clostridium fallax]
MKFFKNIAFLSQLAYINTCHYFKERVVPSNDTLEENSLIWLGHATVIINLYGKIILTDPVMASFLGNFKRLVRLPFCPSNFKIDYVLLSHGHTDHIHFPSLKKINKDATVIVPNGYKRPLKLLGFKEVILLHGGESFKDNNIRIDCFDANHDGRRFYIGKNNRSNSYLITVKDKKVFFAGDTAYTKNFKDINCDIALMPVGCYKPDRFSEMHCTPEESYKMFKSMNCPSMFPIHYKTFSLSLEKFDETIKRLKDLKDSSIKLVDIGKRQSI